jgi:ATP-dependent Clp protease, protease subunit
MRDEKLEAADMMPANERINTGLLNNHIFFLNGIIDEFSTGEAIKWILYENTIEEEKELTMYINSDGGDLTDALALIDIMKNSNYKIKTVGIGIIASAAFLIFACGEKGSRVISKNTSIMCHQFTCGIMGKQHDMEAHFKEMEMSKERVINVLKEATNLSTKVIKEKLLPPTDFWMTVDELVKYGVADIIS